MDCDDFRDLLYMLDDSDYCEEDEDAIMESILDHADECPWCEEVYAKWINDEVMYEGVPDQA